MQLKVKENYELDLEDTTWLSITSLNTNNDLPRMSVVPVPGSSFYRFMLLLGTVAKPKLALETLNHRGSV
jgi:hypothetical protein